MRGAQERGMWLSVSRVTPVLACRVHDCYDKKSSKY